MCKKRAKEYNCSLDGRVEDADVKEIWLSMRLLRGTTHGDVRNPHGEPIRRLTTSVLGARTNAVHLNQDLSKPEKKRL